MIWAILSLLHHERCGHKLKAKKLPSSLPESMEMTYLALGRKRKIKKFHATEEQIGREYFIQHCRTKPKRSVN